MVHDPRKKLERIRRETIKRGPRPPRRRDAPGLAKAIRKGDAALEAANVERQGGTGTVNRASGKLAITFGVGLGCREDAAGILQQANLGFPFVIYERGAIKKLSASVDSFRKASHKKAP